MSENELLAALTAEVQAWREADLYCDVLGYVAGETIYEPDEDGMAHREAIRAARKASDAAGFKREGT